MIFELFEDIVKMGFIVFCLYAVLRAHAHGRPPARSVRLERRRLPVVAVLVLAVLALKATENVPGRMRPDLRPSVSCSGSSFPSGHTLAVAATTTTTATATATAGAIVFTRLWPTSHRWAVSAAFVWAALMALSRIVPGVHGPADVLAAASIGAAIPLPLSLGLAPKRH